jgi:hypothetical protein
VRARRLGGGRRRRLHASVALRGASRDSRHSCNALAKMIGFRLGESTVCRRGAYVPVKNVEAVDCHRRVAVVSRLDPTNDGTQARPDQWERFNVQRETSADYFTIT